MRPKISRAEGKTLSAVVQDALRLAREQRLKRDLQGLQDFWSSAAKAKGILTDQDLDRYLDA